MVVIVVAVVVLAAAELPGQLALGVIEVVVIAALIFEGGDYRRCRQPYPFCW